MHARCSTDHDFWLSRGDDAGEARRPVAAPDTIFDAREYDEAPATVGMSYATFQRLQAEKLAARQVAA